MGSVPAEVDKAQDKVILNVCASENQIPAAGIRTDFPVLVKVMAPPKKERAPIDLVALLDVSPSMKWKGKDPKWTRLELVAVAMQLAIRKMGDTDRLAIVPFSHAVSQPTPLMYMDHKGQNDAILKVLHLKIGSDTKFMPALNYAKRLLGERSEEEKASRPGFVFLLSDGEDRGGILHKEVDIGYPVHTFGMCQKCNPQAMLYVARENKGSYHPIDDDVKNVADALGKFVAGITSVVAVNTHVNFCVPGGESDDVWITKVECGSYGKVIKPDKSKGKEGTINVGVMYARDVKSFVVHLSVPKAKKQDQQTDKQLLLTVGGGYHKPFGRKDEAMVEQKVEVDRTVASPSPSPSDAAPGVNVITYIQDVAIQIVQIQVVTIVQEVVNKHTQGGDGKQIVQKDMATDISSGWVAFKKSDAAIHVKQHLNVGDTYVDDMTNVLNNKEQDNMGVLYAHSWLMAHATQHVTTFAVSTTVCSWFHKEYMVVVAEDFVYNASSMAMAMATPPAGDGDINDPCKCVDFNRIDQRLELWSRVKREVPDLFQASDDAESHHLTAVIRDASLDAINRAMHQDMYLAVVHASNLRQCYCAGKQTQHKPLPVDIDAPLPKEQ